MRPVVLWLEDEELAAKVAGHLDADLVRYHADAFAEAFASRKEIVACMAAGIIVRQLAPLLKDKWEDPAVVLVTPDGRFAVPLLGGHHGANELAHKLAGMNMEPVISTATEAAGRPSAEKIAASLGLEILNRGSTVVVNAALLKADVQVTAVNGPHLLAVGPGVTIMLRPGDLIIGLGCNRGTGADEIVAAVRSVLSEHALREEAVLAYASTVKKRDEEGLVQAVSELGGVLVLLADEVLNAQDVEQSRAELIGLRAVSEAAALVLSRRKELIVKRRAIGNVTVAIAR